MILLLLLLYYFIIIISLYYIIILLFTYIVNIITLILLYCLKLLQVIGKSVSHFSGIVYSFIYFYSCLLIQCYNTKNFSHRWFLVDFFFFFFVCDFWYYMIESWIISVSVKYNLFIINLTINKFRSIVYFLLFWFTLCHLFVNFLIPLQ